MLLEKERERLLAVLQSRTASHQERDRARRTLEGELNLSEWPYESLGALDRPGASNHGASTAPEPESSDEQAAQN